MNMAKMYITSFTSNFNHLLVKEARFEEAKLRDLPTVAAKTPPKGILRKTYPMPNPSRHTNQHSGQPPNEERSRDKAGNRCYHCHSTGHFQKNCPLQGRAVPAESHEWIPGAGQKGNAKRVAALVAARETEANQNHQVRQEREAELCRVLQEAELEESLAEAMATMRVLQTDSKETGPDLGPTLSVQVEFEC